MTTEQYHVWEKYLVDIRENGGTRAEMQVKLLLLPEVIRQLNGVCPFLSPHYSVEDRNEWLERVAPETLKLQTLELMDRYINHTKLSQLESQMVNTKTVINEQVAREIPDWATLYQACLDHKPSQSHTYKNYWKHKVCAQIEQVHNAKHISVVEVVWELNDVRLNVPLPRAVLTPQPLRDLVGGLRDLKSQIKSERRLLDETQNNILNQLLVLQQNNYVLPQVGKWFGTWSRLTPLQQLDILLTACFRQAAHRQESPALAIKLYDLLQPSIPNLARYYRKGIFYIEETLDIEADQNCWQLIKSLQPTSVSTVAPPTRKAPRKRPPRQTSLNPQRRRRTADRSDPNNDQTALQDLVALTIAHQTNWTSKQQFIDHIIDQFQPVGSIEHKRSWDHVSRLLDSLSAAFAPADLEKTILTEG